MSLPSPGDLFEHYKVLKQLGEGGMGQVFLAEDIKLSRKVALKFLVTDSKVNEHTIIRRFENEARVLASFSHPNIVNIYNYGSYAGISYLCMEYVEGSTLSTIINKKAYGVTDSLETIKQVVKGIAEAHRNGVLHRDIKPANILITPDKSVKIVDFGISKSFLEEEQRLTQADHFIGTIHYLAPEILKGHPPGPTTDIYAIGLVFYELLVGVNPFFHKNKFETMERIRSLEIELPEDLKALLSQEFQEVIFKMIARDKSQRYQTAGELYQDLQSLDSSNLPDAYTISVNPQIEFQNRGPVIKKLLAKGYSRNEAQIVFNIAARLSEANASAEMQLEDKTLETSMHDEPSFYVISDYFIDQAIAEFESSKTAIHTASDPELEEDLTISQKGESLTSLTKSEPPSFNDLIDDDIEEEKEVTVSKVITSISDLQKLHEKNLGTITSKPPTASARSQKVNLPNTGSYRHTGTFKTVSEKPRFPLFTPKWIKTGLVIAGIYFAGKWLYNQTINSSQNISPLKMALHFIDPDNSKFNDESTILGKIKKKISRDISSIPNSPLATPQAGSKFRYQIKRYSTVTGIIERNGTSVIRITNSNSKKYVTQEIDNDSGKIRRFQYSANAVIPALKQYRKGKRRQRLQLKKGHETLYPLAIGKSTSFSYNELLPTGRFLAKNRSCEVKDYLSRSVMQKPMNVYVISCVTNSSKETIKTLLYYSPDFKIVVEEASEIQRGSDNLVETIKLIGM